VSDANASAPARRGSPVFTVLPLLVFAGILAVVVRRAARPLSNFDTYFHLRYGDEFLSGEWSLWDPGSVSSFATADWVPTQWLAQVLMAGSEEVLGLAGVAWLAGALQCGLVLALYLTGRRWAGPLVVVPAVLLTLVACAPALSARPQVVSYLLMVVVVGALLRSAEDLRARWWLVPLVWLWAQLHGMWPVGIAAMAVAAIGIALGADRSWRLTGRHLLLPVAAAVAAAVTPVGPKLYGAVLLVSSRQEFFAEWGAPRFVSPSGLAFVLLLAVTLVCLLVAPRVSPFQVVMLLFVGGLAIYSSRTLPLAAVSLLPLLAQGLQPYVGPRSAPHRLETGYVLGVTGAALAALALLVPRTSPDPPPEPAWVDGALASLPAGTVVLNDWGWGGYLMWRHPHLDLVMHGYGDSFTTSELQRNKDIGELEPGWDDQVDDTGARYALLPTDSRLAYALEHHEGWSLVHESEDVAFLVAPGTP
jgi:hypothetical protein